MVPGILRDRRGSDDGIVAAARIGLEVAGADAAADISGNTQEVIGVAIISVVLAAPL